MVSHASNLLIMYYAAHDEKSDHDFNLSSGIRVKGCASQSINLAFNIWLSHTEDLKITVWSALATMVLRTKSNVEKEPENLLVVFLCMAISEIAPILRGKQTTRLRSLPFVVAEKNKRL